MDPCGPKCGIYELFRAPDDPHDSATAQHSDYMYSIYVTFRFSFTVSHGTDHDLSTSQAVRSVQCSQTSGLHNLVRFNNLRFQSKQYTSLQLVYIIYIYTVYIYIYIYIYIYTYVHVCTIYLWMYHNDCRYILTNVNVMQ